jgi:hypothetical protein
MTTYFIIFSILFKNSKGTANFHSDGFPQQPRFNSSAMQHIKIAGAKPTMKGLMTLFTPFLIESTNEKQISGELFVKPEFGP